MNALQFRELKSWDGDDSDSHVLQHCLPERSFPHRLNGWGSMVFIQIIAHDEAKSDAVVGSRAP